MLNNVNAYYRIYLKLKKQIEKGKYRPGEQIPSERELTKIFNVSRTTIRQAVSYLEKDNLIYKIHGKGIFVSENIIKQELNTFYSFHDKMLSLGKKPSSIVISYKKVKCDKFFSQLFKISSLSTIYCIQRLRLVDGIPAMFETTYLPEYRFKNFNFEKLNEIAMYDIFRDEYNVQFEKATENFKPIKIEKQSDIVNLNIPKNSVAMEVIRTTFEYDRVIEYTVSHVKSDLFEYTIVLNKL